MENALGVIEELGVGSASLGVSLITILQSSKIIELYGPGGGLVASADAALVGEPETIAANVAPGRHLLKVVNYAASTSAAD